VEIVLISAFIFLVASNIAMMLTCATLWATQRLWARIKNAMTMGWFAAAILLPLAVGIATSASASISAAWCISCKHPLHYDWHLQRCFLPYMHWCAHLGCSNKLIAIRIAAAVSNTMKLMGNILIILFIIGRIAWHGVWKRAIKPPSAKLLSAASMLPEFSSSKMRIAECDLDFCPAGLFGWLSPTCVISSDIAKALTESELAAVIQHELIHKRRHDHVLRMLLRLLSCVFLSLPWFSWLRRSLEEAVEDGACTEMALRQCAPDFESAMRKCIEMLRERGAPEDALKALTHRLESMRLRGKQQRQLQPRTWLAASLACATLVALVLLLAKPVFGTAHCFLEVVLCGAN